MLYFVSLWIGFVPYFGKSVISYTPRTPLGQIHEHKMHAARLLSQRLFLRKFKMAEEDSHSSDTSVSSEVKKVILTSVLLAHTRILQD